MAQDARTGSELTNRQGRVLQAIVAAYVGEAAPVGSETIAHLLTVSVSSATIRSVMGELAELGLIEKAHASSGRIPTEQGLRIFVDELLQTHQLVDYEKRDLADPIEGAGEVEILHVASQLLSERTRQLGFVLTPRMEHARLRHVSLVRLSSDRLLAVLVTESGDAHRRVVEADEAPSQAELERMAALLNGRVIGRTLREVRDELARDVKALRSSADRFMRRAFELGLRALDLSDSGEADLVIATRLSLLDQPEFQDLGRVRRLFAAIETKEHLVEVLDRMLDEHLSVVFGGEVGEPDLLDCALVVAPYRGNWGRGAIGVIGPIRMDYARVIPTVDYLSTVLSEKLGA